MASAEITTPERAGEGSPQRQTIAITEAQKQALVDNLQLEITERARKLRAQYAFQAQGLRARLELRINRIPQSLRKTTMQDLVDKYTQQNKPSSSPQKLHHISHMISSPAKNRGIKRSSDHFTTASDKENAQPAATAIDLANPKKRSKPNPTTTAVPAPSSPATRARPIPTSKKPTTILSPKSHNSRTLPRSPIKSPPPTKVPARPTAAPKAAAKPTRTASRTTKRAPAPPAEPEPRKTRHSSSSDASAGTTIVRTTKTTTTTKKTTAAVATAAAKEVAAPAPVKKTGTLKSAFNSLTGSKRGKAAAVAAAAKEAAASAAPATTTAGGRVLRKRA